MQPDHLATLQVAAPFAVYSNAEKAVALERELVRRIASLPGVKSVGITDRLPFGDADGTTHTSAARCVGESGRSSARGVTRSL
ncbi:MAG TPA: hypothetical protein VE083_07285 [Terriglobales bacterium]|nr:hypothetical protein [Terriglobales bacterium]